jgi:fucose permease
MQAETWILFFAVGGIGAALLPWITGLVSAHFHSLRYGLVAPCLTGAAMAALN